jgi:hypothetical protein
MELSNTLKKVEDFSPLTGVFPPKEINDTILSKYIKHISNIIEQIIKYKTDQGTYVPHYVIETKTYLEKGKVHIPYIRLIINNKYLLFNANDSIKFKSLLDRLQSIIDNIKDEYAGYDYTYRYFNFFNDNSYLYQINRTRTEIDPEIFVTGTVNNNYGELVFKSLMDNRFIFYDREIEDMFKKNFDIFNGYPFANTIGWTKDMIFTELTKLELFHEEITPVQIIGFDFEKNNGEEKVKDRYLRNYPNLEKHGLTYYSNDYDTEYLDEGGESHSYNYTISENITVLSEPHLLLKRLPKFALEQLYYFGYKPTLKVEKLLDIPNIDTITLRRMFELYFPTPINLDELLRYTKEDFLDIIRRHITMKQFHIEIPTTSKELILQPGGRMYLHYLTKKAVPFSREVTPLVTPQLIQENVRTAKLKQEQEDLRNRLISIPETYKKYLQNCEDVAVDYRTVLFDAIELGLSTQLTRDMEKSEICSIISRYLKIHYNVF